MRRGWVGAPMMCLCTTLGQDGLTARLLVVLSGRAVGGDSDDSIHEVRPRTDDVAVWTSTRSRHDGRPAAKPRCLTLDASDAARRALAQSHRDHRGSFTARRVVTWLLRSR
jgi:hypothetical protein